MLVLADTGILLRLADHADPLHQAVTDAVREVRARGDVPVIGGQNAAEFWNACTRPRTARGGWGLSVADADRRLRAIESAFTLLPEPPGAYPIWRRLVVTHGVQGKQVHDARLVALITTHGFTHVLTLNAGDFARYPGIIEIVPAAASPAPAPIPAPSPPP